MLCARKVTLCHQNYLDGASVEESMDNPLAVARWVVDSRLKH